MKDSSKLVFQFALVLSVFVWTIPTDAAEEQAHGFSFEQLVWNHMFGRGYTDDWDIPGSANLITPGIPISVKFIQWKNSVYLGDAVRQWSINESFEMVVGFYEKRDGVAEVVALHQISFSPEEWRILWGDVTLAELEAFSAQIKQGTIDEAQTFARTRAAELRKRSGVFSINPKINKDQRRIQCSWPFTKFYRDVMKQEAVKQKDIELWSRPFSKKIQLGKRLKN
ncbi:MAG: hypothetical protein AAF558_02100 [Verrucomicrobiota bacterium]